MESTLMSTPTDPTPERDVSQLRAELDELDARSLAFLARRRELVREVVRAKSADGKAVRDPLREEALLERLISLGREQGLDAHFVTKVFGEIIADSVRLQVEDLQQAASSSDPTSGILRVAFQGGPGAYSELAANNHFATRSERLATQGFRSFADAAREVEERRFDYAILPIENTTTGSIIEVYDLLRSTSLTIVGELRLKIEHCLIATEETPIERITRVSSHPQAILQCSKFLERLVDTEVDAFTDTGLAVAHIKELADPTHAAIAGAAAARKSDLVILSREIANEAENYTRFVIVAREPEPLDPLVPARTSLVISTGQKAGSLVEALLVFRDRGLPLSKLENRPIPGRPFEEQFYIDFEGAQGDAAVIAALEDLTRVTRYLKVLGSYPRCDHEPSSPSARAVSELPDTTPGPTESAQPSAPAVHTKVPSGWRLASREHKSEDTIIQIGSHELGGDTPTLIAGPCAVEYAEQINSCARIVKEAGAQILRGGVFKPRTSPYSFQGLGYEGLDLLVEAGRTHGLPIITEVLAPEDVEPVAARVDVLQIGARNMQNFPLLKKVGSVDRPVMLKRGLMASIEELLQAAEYILSHGNQQVFLCERGIRTFETATRNTLDLGAIPILRKLTHLPVIVDPSHAAGRRDLVPPLVRAASAIGAQGVMVEIHPKPEEALSDGPQALRFPVFQELAREFFRE
jgi:chorismate mutase/prephenate dehydratase